jgi:hypothetical protein
MAGSPEAHLSQPVVRADKRRIDVAIIDHRRLAGIRVRWQFP